MHAERSLQDTLALRPDQELHDKVAETDFAAATCGLTILRYITGSREGGVQATADLCRTQHEQLV
jgi:hypothetical protein